MGSNSGTREERISAASREIGAPSDHLCELFEEAKERNPEFAEALESGDRVLPALEVKVTSFCTLRCKDCTHLIPYVKAPAHMPVSCLIRDLGKILSVAKIEGLIFLGGEIMIYPYLGELMEAYGDLGCDDRVGFVRVTTNGTVVPPDTFCEAFKKLSNGYVTISDYGSLSSHREEAVQKLRSCGIEVKVIPNDHSWRSLGDWLDRHYTEEEVHALYAKCHGKLYLHLYKDHLYHCYRAPVLNEDGLIPCAESDFLDLNALSEKELAERLPAFMDRFACANSCRYCDGFHNDSPLVGCAVQLS